MKITKYLHSCLVVEEHEKTILIDPGHYTFDANVFPLAAYPEIDYILITHEHRDHMHLPFIKEAIRMFPTMKIISNESVVTLLEREHITAYTTPEADIAFTPLSHERNFDGAPPEHTGFLIGSTLLHPGDSYQFTTAPKVLALPMASGWGSTTSGFEKAVAAKPHYIIPIHDWLWKDEIRKKFYKRAREYFRRYAIEFKPVETGETIEIQ